MTGITERDKFLEILSIVRHYSTLRFAMLTVFVAVNGGLLTQFFDCEFAAKNPEAMGLFRLAGSVLALIFLIFERALDHNLSHYWSVIAAYVGKHDALVSGRSRCYRWSVPLATHSIFILSLLFWLCFASDFYPCQT